MFIAYLIAATPSFAIDTDHDGLSDDVETNTGIYVSLSDTGTDPNNSDTDSDGMNDGIETNNGGGIALNFEQPSWGNPLIGLDGAGATALLAPDSYHRLMPTLSRDGAMMAYVRTDGTYGNPAIAYTTVAPPHNENVLCSLNQLCLIQQLSFSPDNTAVFYTDYDDNNTPADTTDDARNIFSVTLTGQVTQQTDSTLTNNRQYYTPEVVSYSASSPVTPKSWVFVGRYDASNVLIDGTEITAYPLINGTMDLPSGVSVMNIGVGNVGEGIEICPRLSVDGRFMISSVLPSLSLPIHTYIRIARGIEDVLLGSVPILSLISGDRLDSVGSSSNSWQVPTGFSPTGNVYFFTFDQNSAGILDLFNFDFSQSDFDFTIGAVQNLGSGDMSFRGANTRVPLVGNQIWGAASLDGTQLCYTSDDDFTSTTNQHLYTANIIAHNRLPFLSGTLTGAWRLEDPSGVALVLPDISDFDLTGAENGETSRTITMQSLPVAGSSIVEGEARIIRIFSPSGATFSQGAAADPPKLVYRYLDQDVEGIDEGQLAVKKYNSATMEFDIDLPILSRDPANNIIEAEISGFSEFGIVAPPLLRVRHSWAIYD